MKSVDIWSQLFQANIFNFIPVRDRGSQRLHSFSCETNVAIHRWVLISFLICQRQNTEIETTWDRVTKHVQYWSSQKYLVTLDWLCKTAVHNVWLVSALVVKQCLVLLRKNPATRARGFSCTLTVQIGGLSQRNMKISITALERMDAPSMSMVTIFSQWEWWSLHWNKYCANQALINASRVLIDAPGFPFPLGHL